jgi:hypothetical protein
MIETIRWLARLNSDACCQIENLFRESRTTEAFQNGVPQESQAAPSTSSHRPKVAALLGVTRQVNVPDRRRRNR